MVNNTINVISNTFWYTMIYKSQRHAIGIFSCFLKHHCVSTCRQEKILARDRQFYAKPHRMCMHWFSLNIFYLHKTCKWDWTQVIALVRVASIHFSHLTKHCLLFTVVARYALRCRWIRVYSVQPSSAL